VGESGGGMANAIAGRRFCWLSQPDRSSHRHPGGIFLAEFGRGTKLANAVRFTADVLNGVPSIVMGSPSTP